MLLKSRYRQLSAALLASSLILTLAACGGDDETGSAATSSGGLERNAIMNYEGSDREAVLYECAKKEGEVVYYTSLGAAKTVLKEGFQAKYPGVKLTEFIDAAIGERLVSEETAGRHVVDVYGDLYGRVPRDDNYFVSFKSPNREGLIPALDDPYYAGTGGFILSLAYNSKLVPAAEVPKTWEDLLDPKWKGQIIGAGGSTATFMSAAIGQEKGLDFLKQLSDVVQIQAGVTSGGIADLLVAGQAKFGWNVSSTNISKDANTPFGWIPLDPMVAHYQVDSISKSAPHPCAAMLYVDWLLSDEGQKAINDFGRSSSKEGKPLLPVEVPGQDPNSWNLKFVTDKAFYGKDGDTFDAFVEKWTKTYQDLFE